MRPGNVGRIAVFASWNGATEVARWRIFAGDTEDDLTQVSEAPRSGFETRIDVVTSKPVVAVQALNAAGKAMAASRPATVRI